MSARSAVPGPVSPPAARAPTGSFHAADVLVIESVPMAGSTAPVPAPAPLREAAQLPGLDSLALLAVRRPAASTHGARVVLGWLVTAAGDTPRAAHERVRACTADLRQILAVAHPGVALAASAATAERALLFDVLSATHATVLTPAPVSLASAVGPDAQALAAPPVPWPWDENPRRWKHTLELLGSATAGTAWMVRVGFRPSLPASVRDRAVADLLTVRALERTLQDQRPGRVEPLSVRTLLEQAAERHVVALDTDPCTAHVLLLSRSAISPALVAVACTEAAGERVVGLPRAEALSRSEIPAALLHGLLPDAACRPVTLTEASALCVLPESPVDESTALPATRARLHRFDVPIPDGTRLGTAHGTASDVEVRFDDEARLRHTYVIGQTGTGKSTLLASLVLQDIARGLGVTLLDPHGTLVRDVLERMPAGRRDDVVLVDPGDPQHVVPMNPLVLGTDDPDRYVARRDTVIDDLLDTLDGLYDLKLTGGPMFERYFRTFVTIVAGSRPAARPPSLLMLDRAMSDKAFRKTLVEALGPVDRPVRAALEAIEAARGESELANMTPYITSKVGRFVQPRVARRMLCTPSNLDFDALVAEHKIVLVSLPPLDLGRWTSALLARVVVDRVFDAARAAGPTREVRHALYVDEFQNVASERFTHLFSEARKFGLALTVAHQYTSQLARSDARLLDAVLGNVGTFVSFRVGAADAAVLEPVMAPRASAGDLAGLGNYRALVRSTGSLGGVPFTLRTHPLAAGDPAVAHAVARVATLRHARSVGWADEEIVRQLGGPRRADAPCETPFWETPPEAG